MPDETPLVPILREEIRASGGRITFARFMELCLYHPQHGYYNTERVKLGARGDFYTNAHAAPVFPRLLARHFELLWNELGRPDRFDLVELGPGDGQFAAELLPWIAKRFPEFFSRLHYTAIEQSHVLGARLKERLTAFGDNVRILETIAPRPGEEDGITGYIFANEFFDALPIHMLVWRDGRWLERYVSLNGATLAWREDFPSSALLVESAESCSGLAQTLRQSGDVFVAEVRPQVDYWLRRLSLILSCGEALVLDYGYTLNEWRQGRFPQGSALTYSGHQASADLLCNPGQKDLTARVNFTGLTETAQQCGLQQWNFCSQANFLMELGEPDEFHDVFADCTSDLERQQRALLLKTLILPQGMGTTFQVLQLRKGM